MSSIQRAGHSNWIIGGVACLAVVGFVISLLLGIERYRDVNARVQANNRQNAINAAQNAALKLQQAQQAADENCIADYNARVNRRNQRIEGRFERRDRAAHTLVIRQLHGASHQTINHARRVFLLADRLYLRALKLNPIPSFHCASHNVGRVPFPPVPRVPAPPARPSTSPGVQRPRPTPGRRSTAPKARAPRGKAHGRGHHPHLAHRVRLR